ncbi:aspartate/glutamate racemase family protein [Subtercola sp. RTI3]|uniref:aspartate/glutamate racemase family protein n=1 Tax=Subtercola sp. RTI3 TaxID=3048639 RepID=UPI002B23736D|nr:aspartate/glutamate racemase family protein [Subtercola sp. RTI3]MEA9987267.1 aspartate/glutamate racemase family protein [Subtercola sp. RTI3]
MKTIGLLGGMSWESSALYYQLINEGVRDQLGGLHSAKIILASVDFAEIEHLQSTNDWDAAGQLLAEQSRRLEAAGADFIVLCTNTMHKVAPSIQSAVAIPLLHIADTTAAAVTDSGMTTVGLLGTSFTMEQGFYKDRISTHGLTVLVPDAAQRQIIHRIIYEELVLGIVSDASRTQYVSVIAALHHRGAEGIILGCTEIELLISEHDSPIPTFPTTRLHARAAMGL